MRKVTSDDLWFDFETAPPYRGNISIKYGELSKSVSMVSSTLRRQV
jgi:hypothetical protein